MSVSELSRYEATRHNINKVYKASFIPVRLYTVDFFRSHPLLLQLLVSEERYFKIMIVFNLSSFNIVLFQKT